MVAITDKITGGHFVVTGEINPPKGTNLDGLLNTARILEPWLDGVNITDSHTAKMSMSPMAPAVRLKAVGPEPIVQITGRDRNRISIQGDLLSLSELGIDNVVCMSGDDPEIGDHPEAKGVFDLDAIGLLKTVSSLNAGHDLTGNSLSGHTQFCAGAVANPGADDLGHEIERLVKKIEAGACFVQTQPVYDFSDFEPFLTRCASLNVHVLAGIMPLKSVSMAQYLNNHVPGIRVATSTIERIAGADNIVSESLAIAASTFTLLKESCSGVHIMAMGWEHHIPELMELAGFSRRN